MRRDEEQGTRRRKGGPEEPNITQRVVIGKCYARISDCVSQERRMRDTRSLSPTVVATIIDATWSSGEKRRSHHLCSGGRYNRYGPHRRCAKPVRTFASRLQPDQVVFRLLRYAVVVQHRLLPKTGLDGGMSFRTGKQLWKRSTLCKAR